MSAVDWWRSEEDSINFDEVAAVSPPPRGILKEQSREMGICRAFKSVLNFCTYLQQWFLLQFFNRAYW